MGEPITDNFTDTTDNSSELRNLREQKVTERDKLMDVGNQLNNEFEVGKTLVNQRIDVLDYFGEIAEDFDDTYWERIADLMKENVLLQSIMRCEITRKWKKETLFMSNDPSYYQDALNKLEEAENGEFFGIFGEIRPAVKEEIMKDLRELRTAIKNGDSENPPKAELIKHLFRKKNKRGAESNLTKMLRNYKQNMNKGRMRDGVRVAFKDIPAIASKMKPLREKLIDELKERVLRASDEVEEIV